MLHSVTLRKSLIESLIELTPQTTSTTMRQERIYLGTSRFGNVTNLMLQLAPPGLLSSHKDQSRLGGRLHPPKFQAHQWKLLLVVLAYRLQR